MFTVDRGLSVSAPSTSRFVEFPSVSNTRQINFPTEPRGHNSNFHITRGGVEPNPQPRRIDFDGEELRSTDLFGPKVRISNPELITGLPKSMSDVIKGLESLEDSGVLTREQAERIAARGRDDFSEALSTLVNIISHKASTPQEVQDILQGKKPDNEDGDGDDEEEKTVLQFPPSRHKQDLPDIPTINVMFAGIPSEIVSTKTWAANKDVILDYIRARGALVINFRTGNTNGISTTKTYLSASRKENRYLLDLRNQCIIPAGQLDDALHANDTIRGLFEDHNERKRNLPLVDEAKAELVDLKKETKGRDTTREQKRHAVDMFAQLKSQVNPNPWKKITKKPSPKKKKKKKKNNGRPRGPPI